MGTDLPPVQPDAEARSARPGSGFTAEIMAARESYIAGRRGIGELTATVQACVSLWEGASGPRGRRRAPTCSTGAPWPWRPAPLALRGEAVFLIRDDGWCRRSDWDLSTRDGRPRAYRLSVPEAGGGRSRDGARGRGAARRSAADPVAPWIGTAPLRRASLTAGLLHALEAALAEVYELAPLGSQVVPFPENPAVDNERARARPSAGSAAACCCARA